ncbi:hemolymph lipopolysaccharide-binding protein-like [Hylaeus anthracinus]|uniref:hemolymph lipopolysaccharide-binding protein-like n=1 Tax=Hylaeus anthracinus TaxID=313031 RepID=UPI0023B9EC93|nr:hemolymph lipopolysaccharide-binding protein-like [Hylaeus anthracinus]
MSFLSVDCPLEVVAEMYKRSLIFFVFASGILCNEGSTVVDVLEPSQRQKRQANGTRSDSPSVVNMNGHFNYQATQQIFFINGMPQKHRKGLKSCVSYVERDDYVITVGVGVHKFHRRRLMWNQARKSCLNEGGQLAVLNSDREEKLLTSWIGRENFERAFVGIHDLYEEGEWLTVASESLEATGFERWSTNWPNLPDNLGGRQNCGVLEKSGGYDDIDCDATLPYICEISLC